MKIDKQELNHKAEDIFLKISGLDREGRKYERMKEDAFRVRKLVEEKLDIVAEYRSFDDLKLQGDCLTVADTDIICGTFMQLEHEMLEGAYLYVVSVGDVSLPEAKAIEQLYADFWGNAYTDALRMMLIEELGNTSAISDSFGPGFYGMDSSELIKFSQLLDFTEKGISVKDRQMMIPQKSCTGLIFKVNDKYRKLDAACESCQGNHLSCSMCIINRSK